MASWAGRVSPVFDVAKRLTVVDVEAGRQLHREELALEEQDPIRRAQRVAAAGVGVLICGAISRPLEQMLTAGGVEVIPQTCGPVDQVLAAFVTGGLDGGAFLMPGCRRRRGRFGHGWRGGRRSRWM